MVQVLTWKHRRDKMADVCAACHSKGVIEGHQTVRHDVVALATTKIRQADRGRHG